MLLRRVYRSHLHVLLWLWTAGIVWWCVSIWLQQQQLRRRRSRDDIVGTTGKVPTLSLPPSHYGLHPDDVQRSSPCLHADFASKVPKYLRALHHAVQIVPLPAALSDTYRSRCDQLRQEGIRASMGGHAHALELQFPWVLRDMSSSAVAATTLATAAPRHAQAAIDPLWRPGGPEPLFYYVEALPYHVVYCTRKRNQKEDWTGRDAYWTQVAQHVVGDGDGDGANASTFLKHMGTDFILPASHPQLGPGKIHPSALSYLLRASFLKTDFDISGAPPKDVIVPYYVPPERDGDAGTDATDTRTDGSWWCRNATTSTDRRPRLLFFAGSDNPRGGYRTLFLRSLEQALGASSGTTRGRRRVVDRDGVYVSLTQLAGPSPPWQSWQSWWPGWAGWPSTSSGGHGDDKGDGSDSKGGEQWYARQLRTSRYCLVLRGDTTSSKRFFAAVASGCVPVVVSDGLRLPFDEGRMVDYRTFALFFPESVAFGPGGGMARMLEALRAVPEHRYRRLRCALGAARRYLLYRQAVPAERPQGRNASLLSTLNPVTLALVELLMRREQQCRQAEAPLQGHGGLCANLLRRLTS